MQDLVIVHCFGEKLFMFLVDNIIWLCPVRLMQTFLTVTQRRKFGIWKSFRSISILQLNYRTYTNGDIRIYLSFQAHTLSEFFHLKEFSCRLIFFQSAHPAEKSLPYYMYFLKDEFSSPVKYDIWNIPLQLFSSKWLRDESFIRWVIIYAILHSDVSYNLVKIKFQRWVIKLKTVQM